MAGFRALRLQMAGLPGSEPADGRPHGPRVCLKIHSHHLHAPLRGIFGPNSVNVARYASLIGTKSPTKWDVHLTESNFQTRSRAVLERLPAILRHIYVLLVVGIGWVLFRADTMAAAAGFLGDMFSLTLMGTHERELAELLCGGKFLLQFAGSVLFCTPHFAVYFAPIQSA